MSTNRKSVLRSPLKVGYLAIMAVMLACGGIGLGSDAAIARLNPD